MNQPTKISVANVGEERRYEPWIGDHYRRVRKAADAGLTACCDGLWHVMGESHYESDDVPEITRLVMEKEAFSGYRFFDKLLSVLSEDGSAQQDRKTAWSRVAFSNYVQDMMPTRVDRPKAYHWRRARERFFSQLAITRPKQLLVVGKMQWDKLPSEGFTAIEPFEVRPEWGPVSDAGLYAYQVNGNVTFTIATWIYHPSSRGKLDVHAAQDRVRSVTMASCNILSDLRYDGSNWLF